MMSKKQEKIDKILEEEKKAREFKASEMPDLHKPVGLPIKEVLLPTDPQPFKHQASQYFIDGYVL